MIRQAYFVRLALSNLRRGGQRVLVALLCIAFGVMSLVAMTMLAKSIEATVVLQPAEILGGDLTMGRAQEEYILPEQIEQLKTLQQAGEISRYTLIAYDSGIMFHTPGSGEMHFVNNAYGIAPEEYPLAGSLTIGQPGSTGLPTLLQQVGDVVITRDLAQEYNLNVGDRLVLADLDAGAPVPAVVRGIAYDTPNHQGNKLYYTVATAQALAAGGHVYTVAVVTAPHPETLAATLEQTGWLTSSAADAARMNAQTVDMILIGLRGAGILGLLVGGVGIANTMQVLLRRRQRDIAIWKTLGYREDHLRVMFTLEAGLLGLAGSVIGAGLGVLISEQLLELFRRTSTLLYVWSFSPIPPLLGVLTGTATTVIFAYWAIVVSSQARPMALLRNEPVTARQLSRWQSAGLALLLAVPFTALAGLVMESVTTGIGVLVATTLGIAVLGAAFAGVLWVCTRLPLRNLPLAHMAINSLRRRGIALIFAMIALFIGVLSMSLGLVVTQNGQREMSARAVDIQGYNLNVVAPADQEGAVRQAVQTLNPEKVGVSYRTALKALAAVGSAEPTRIQPVLEGRSQPDGYVLAGAVWGSQPGAVYVGKWSGLGPGDRVQATFADGATRVFPVAGTYSVDYSSNSLRSPSGLLISAGDFLAAATPEALTYFVRVDPGQVAEAAAALGAALPQASVLNMVSYAARFLQTYQNLFVLAMAMSGLALLAGILLVANSVSLAMLDRNHEIGVLKTVGYARGQVLTMFAVEYGLVGVLATAAGILVVQALMGGLALANHVAAGVLLLTPGSIGLAVACGVGLILLTVIAVTWKPTGVSPVVVLNERNG